MKKNIAICTLLMTILLAIAGCGDAKPTANTSSNKGDLAPQFVLKDLAGEDVALADLAGEKVYIKYWASWCSICLAGLDDVDKLAAEDNGFKVISIVSPEFNAEKPTEQFIKWYERLEKENIPVLLDEDGIYAKQFKVIAYPTSYYIGSDGVLVKMIPGHNTNEQIKKEMTKIN